MLRHVGVGEMVVFLALSRVLGAPLSTVPKRVIFRVSVHAHRCRLHYGVSKKELVSWSSEGRHGVSEMCPDLTREVRWEPAEVSMDELRTPPPSKSLTGFMDVAWLKWGRLGERELSAYPAKGVLWPTLAGSWLGFMWLLLVVVTKVGGLVVLMQLWRPLG